MVYLTLTQQNSGIIWVYQVMKTTYPKLYEVLAFWGPSHLQKPVEHVR